MEGRYVVSGGVIWHKPNLLWGLSASNGKEGTAEEDPVELLAWDEEESNAPVTAADEFVIFRLPEGEDDAVRPVLRKLL